MKYSQILDFIKGGKIINHPEPSAPGDLVPRLTIDKKYHKNPVRVVSLANLDLNGTETIDGVSLSSGDRVLVVAQTAGSENGIYIVNTGAWTRATDMATGFSVAGAIVPVLGGASANTLKMCSNAIGSDVVGTHTLTFVSPAGPSKRVYSIVGDGAQTEWSFTHGLGSDDIIAMLKEDATKLQFGADIESTDANNVKVIFAVAPANAEAFTLTVLA